MYTIDDIKVTLLNGDEVKNFIFNHGSIACVCYNTPKKFANKVGESCLVEGHTSGSRGDYFKFEIVCPRFCADQIMRHFIGTFYNCQSQRYVDMDDDFSIYVPPTVLNDESIVNSYALYERQCKEMYKVVRNQMDDLGIKGEKANDLMRTMLPIGVKTKLVAGFDIEALIHFCHKRLCVRADLPIRKVAEMMRDLVIAIEPRYADLLVPQCRNLLYCPEKHGCKMYPSKEEVQNLIKLGKDCCKNNPLDEFCNGDCSNCNKCNK